MMLGKFGTARKVYARKNSDSLKVLRNALPPVRCEALEARWLLSAYVYDVPSGPTSAFLEARPGFAYQVDVHLDSPTNPVAYRFLNTSGVDVIDAGTNANFKFFDQVPAGDKPRGDSDGDQGIRVQGGADSSLEVDVSSVDGNADVSVNPTTYNSASGAEVDVATDGGGVTQFASGVTNVIIADSNPGTTITASKINPNLQLSILTGDGTGDTISLGDSAQGHTVKGAYIDAPGANQKVFIDSDEDDPSTATVNLGDGTGSQLVAGGQATYGIYDAATVTLTSSVDQLSISPNACVIVDSIISGDNLKIADSGYYTAHDAGTLIIKSPATVGSLSVSSPNFNTRLQPPIDDKQNLIDLIDSPEAIVQ